MRKDSISDHCILCAALKPLVANTSRVSDTGASKPKAQSLQDHPEHILNCTSEVKSRIHVKKARVSAFYPSTRDLPNSSSEKTSPYSCLTAQKTVSNLASAFECPQKHPLGKTSQNTNEIGWCL